MIEIIYHLFLTAIFGYLSFLFTRFIDFCIGEPHGYEVNKGRIFSKVGIWVRSNYDRVESEISNERNLKVEKLTKELAPIKFIEEAANYTRVNYWKALGVCPVCFNVWICFITFFFVWNYTGLPVFFLVPYVVFSNHLVRKWLSV